MKKKLSPCSHKHFLLANGIFLVCCLWFPIQAAQLHSQPFKTISMNKNGLVGELYLPKSKTSSMTVLVVGGSSGRLNQDYSERLAANGMVALSLAYFGAAGLPGTLDNVPVETVSKALDYLQSHPQVDARSFGILGVSRGSELAFLSATIDPRIKAVVGIVPTVVAWHGQTSPHAWTVKGQAIPALSFPRQSTASIYLRAETALATQEAQQAQFEFEEINGPILLISAKDDHIWPSEPMARQVVTYLKQRDFKFPVKHLTVNDNHFLDQATVDRIEQLLVNHFKQNNTSQ